MKALTYMLVMIIVGLGCSEALSVEKEKSGSKGSDEVSWLTDFEQAKRIALKNNKAILADFSGSDWCGWCIKLEKEVFSTDIFKNYAKDNLVLFLADFPARKQQPEALKRQNQALAQKYGIRGYPTVLIIDGKGEIVARTGYRRGGPEKYVEHIKDILKSKSS